MKLYDAFDRVTSGPWVTGGRDIQYKLENRVLYLQCSASESDWAFNFDVACVPYKEMQEPFLVHRGFLNAWQSVRDEIALLNFDIIIGYSMGGALAVLAHEDFNYRRGYQPATIVFGCPRVLYRPPESVKQRFTNIQNVHNERDIVSMNPFWCTPVGQNISLDITVSRPTGTPLLAWLSGHTPQEYRLKLKDI